MKTFVLVHGAWHGGWVWRRVADILRGAGHEVLFPSLTGSGDRSHLLDPKVSLTTHVRDMTNLIETHGLPEVVLCGHSYGGLVAAQAADQLPDRVARLVFLDAFLPEDGLSLLDLLPAPFRTEMETLARGQGEGWLVPAPPVERLQIPGAADRAWVAERLGPHPLACFDEPSSVTGAWAAIPRLTYVAALGFDVPVFDRSRARARTHPTFDYHEAPTGHEIMVEAPETVARILAA
jgi:pimeloyl-ACP methyl ester carboxylesterase